MITKEQIESIGFDHVATMSNGGSKLFRINKIYALEYNGDNFLYKENFDLKSNEIIIKKLIVEKLEWEILYKGYPTFDELNKLVIKYCK